MVKRHLAIMEHTSGTHYNIKQCTSLDNFKTMLNAWEGPQCQCSMCNVLK